MGLVIQVMTNSREKITDTVRRMRDNDIACQMVLRFQNDPDAIHHPTSHAASRVRELARRVIEENRLPRTVGEWIAVVLHHEQRRQVEEMRRRAHEEAQIAYDKAKLWLQIIDKTVAV